MLSQVEPTPRNKLSREIKAASTTEQRHRLGGGGWPGGTQMKHTQTLHRLLYSGVGLARVNGEERTSNNNNSNWRSLLSLNWVKQES